MILLDSNTCIALLRGTSPHVKSRLMAHDPVEIYICSIVRAELLFGARRSARVERNLLLTHEFLENFETLPFDDRAAESYALIRAALAASGQPIGANDMLIAAIAKSRGALLVTNNVREFSRIEGLAIEDWLIAE